MLSSRVISTLNPVLVVSQGLRWAGIIPPYHDTHPYQVQVFSRDPLVLHVDSFLSSDEIAHVLKISEGKYETSSVYSSDDVSVNLKARVSESAIVPRDDVVRRIEKRAARLMGWRGNHTHLQPLKVQRYGVGGFYTFHYDWDGLVDDGNRATTFMIYLVADCTGGGTNFPRLPMPEDTRWCSVIECEEGRDGYEGVTFKPVSGSAVYWENIYPNGTLHPGVRHASLPVKSGVKVGLNIWSWDDAWRKPEEVDA
ncbi:hypothetical protein B0T14DRAFT_432644 [Immersiella caudata]|uniref:Fe2OG dioxygenase domain-containing protein n=1 Tax=Immersiella caudata TaxID=314043 RepID=A0AA39WSR6_9PEZI|nr:hypothetical protein B0T14DRAFT_432644 [Immersiella caudata]